MPGYRRTFRPFVPLGVAIVALLTASPGMEAAAQATPSAAVAETCSFPKPSAKATIVFGRTAPTRALSSVALGSQDDLTYVADVRVDRGTGPFYAVLVASVPVIWDVEVEEGDIERLVVIGPGKRGPVRAGVRGVSPKMVSFVPLEACQISDAVLYRSERDHVHRFLESHLGKPPDDIVSFGRDTKVIVLGRADSSTAGRAARIEAFDPQKETGQREAGKPGHDIVEQLKAEIRRYYPGGIREFSPEVVIAPAEVERYRPLPHLAGLIQLVEDGAIRAISPAEAQAWQDGASRPYRFRLSPGFRYRPRVWPPRFVVTRQIHLPAYLAGPFSSSFLIPEGVPAPSGNPRHSCLFFMEGYRVLPMYCVGEEPSARSAALDLKPDEAKACRVFELDDDEEVAALSIYGGKDSASFSKRNKKAGVDVLVKRPGRTVLVVSGRLPVVWNIRSAEGAEVSGVLAIGYEGKQELIGLPKSVPVRHLSKKDVIDGRLCSPGEWLLNAYVGGPFALALDVYVQRLTGRRIDWLDGTERAEAFVVP
ncbi:MAG: hypothetical protein QNJ30_18340 [Kiloniellales bacterium]|nr:hypothetical protein [Kiloniellales bacterium]